MSVTPESVQVLLASPSSGDRLSGLNQLRQLEPGRAFALIQPLLNDGHVRVRYAAVSQMATLGSQNPVLALELLRSRLLQDKELDVRAAAADALGALGCESAYPDLEAAYRGTGDWVLQLSIVAALGELGNPAGFELLAEALDSETELVRMAAILALGELGDGRAIPLLDPLAQNGDWQLRCRVAQALGHFPQAEAQAVLQALAQDEVEQVAQIARLGLQSPSGSTQD